MTQMANEKHIPLFWMVIATIGAFVSVGGICLAMGGMLLIDHDTTMIGVAMILGGTATYIAILNWRGWRAD